MSEDNGKDVPRNTAGVDDGDAKVERHEARPVHIALVIDTTGSRSEFIDDARIELRRQMEVLKDTLDEVSSIGNLQITLATFGGGEIKIFNTFNDPVLVAEAFKDVECENDLTRICDTLERLGDCVDSGDIPDVDAVFFIGDTMDGHQFEIFPPFDTVNLGSLYNTNPYMVPNAKTPDTDLNLFESGKLFGAPIITMVHASEQTTLKVHHSFQLLSRGSGVEECPLMYNADIKFADYMLATAAMVAGPQAVEELQDKQLVDAAVWDDIKPETFDSVHEPVDPPEPIVVYQDRIVEKEVLVEEKRRNWPFWVGMGATFGMGVIVGCLLCSSGYEEQDEPALLDEPEPVTTLTLPPSDAPRTLIDDFRDNGNVTFSDLNSPINFQIGSTEITPGFSEYLDALGALLERNDDGLGVFVVEGHASTIGTRSDNMNLSKDRALAVLDYLENNFQIQIPMFAVGCGEEDLAADPELTLDDRNANRRVAFQTDGVLDAEIRGCELAR